MNAFVRRCQSIVLLIALPLLASRARADEPSALRVDTRAQLIAALQKATPGTTILLAPGTYRGGLSHAGLQGTPEQPIVIAAADPERPPVIQGGGGGLHFTDPAHLELRGLTIDGASGNGLNIDDGGTADTPAHHVALVDLVVRNVGPRGNRDGIKLSGLADFRVETCTVERWGDGGSGIDMVGCRDGLITGCTFRHKDAPGANGVQAKGGSSRIVVRNCRFEHAGSRAVNIGGSTGLQFFRPRPQGYEAREITVEDCTIIGSAVAFVGVDGAIVRHNTLYRPTPWAVRILQETTGPEFVPCRNGRFTNNIVAFRSDEIRTVINIGPGTAPDTFSFAENVWHCIDAPDATRRLVRLPVAETGAAYGVDPQFRAPTRDDLRHVLPERLSAGPREHSSPLPRPN